MPKRKSHYQIHWCSPTELSKLFGRSVHQIKAEMQKIGLLDEEKRPTDRSLELEIYDDRNGWWKRFAVVDLLEDEAGWKALKPRKRVKADWHTPCMVRVVKQTHFQFGRILSAQKVWVVHDSEGNQVLRVLLSNGDEVNGSWVEWVEDNNTDNRP